MNTALDRLNSWVNGRTDRQAATWRRRSEALRHSLPDWRTPHRLNLLVRIYVGSFILGLATAVIQIFWTPFLLIWLPFTAIMLVSSTMLRTVINARDLAPDNELDEYESAVLRTWQSTAYRWLGLVTLVASAYMIVLGTVAPDDMSHWIYSGGLLAILGLLATQSLPVIAYATTFGPVPSPGNISAVTDD